MYSTSHFDWADEGRQAKGEEEEETAEGCGELAQIPLNGEEECEGCDGVKPSQTDGRKCGEEALTKDCLQGRQPRSPSARMRRMSSALGDPAILPAGERE